MSDKNQQKILLAGGGTAGHVEPALATANWLKENSPDLICEFVGTLSGLETSLVPLSGFTLHTIKKAALPRKFSLQSIAWPFRFLQSLSGARKALAGDIAGDGVVDSADLLILSQQWLSAPGDPSADIAPDGGDGIVNFLDYAVLAGHWMEGK